MRLSLTILLCLLLVHCSENSVPEHIRVLDEIPGHIQEVKNLTIYPGDSEPLYEIELIPVQSFGETGEPYLTEIMGSVVDDKGRILIWNSNTGYEMFLYVFNDDGTYHTQIGRQGSGPGEYGFVFDLQARAEKVLVRDITNQRLNIYNTNDYSFDRAMLIEQLAIRDHEAVQGLQLGLIMARNDGNYFVSFSQGISGTEHIYLLMDTDGNVLNFEPLVFPSSLWISVPTRSMAPSFGLGSIMGQTLTTLTSEDALYSAWTRDFLIRKYDADGNYQSAIYYPIQGTPFDSDEYTKTVPFGYTAREIERAIENTDIELPETNPVLADLMVDDENRIWAAVPMDSQREIYEWWILAPSGELLAKLLRPRVQRIFDIKQGYLYGRETNEETGAEYVVKYRIELTES